MSNFGRIPAGTAELLARLAHQVRDDVVSVLEGAPDKVRAHTLERVMGTVLTDWHENDNTSGLLADDVSDLRSFIALAKQVALPDPWNKGLPIYEATLQGLLDDWLANWNAPGQPGPPRRQG